MKAGDGELPAGQRDGRAVQGGIKVDGFTVGGGGDGGAERAVAGIVGVGDHAGLKLEAGVESGGTDD